MKETGTKKLHPDFGDGQIYDSDPPQETIKVFEPSNDGSVNKTKYEAGKNPPDKPA